MFELANASVICPRNPSSKLGIGRIFFLTLFTWEIISNLQVPHSQCSLRENPKFLQNFRSKNNTLKANF
jgi:hypothetical protein